MPFCLTILTILVVFSECVLAQLEYEPFRVDTTLRPPPRNNFIMMGFDKNLATYQWNGTARIEQIWGDFSLSLNEQFRSTVIQTAQKLIRDEQWLELNARQALMRRLATTVRLSNFVLSDDQKFTDGQRPGLTSASSNAFYGGVEMEVLDNVFAEPMVGVRFDNQVGIRDRGATFAIDAWTRNLDFGGYQSKFAGRFQRDWVLPRTLEKRSATFGVGKSFPGRTRDTLQVTYTSNQRDFYFSADPVTTQQFAVMHNIERRVEDVIGVSNLLEYDMGEGLLASLEGSMSSRSIDRQFRYRPLIPPPSQTLVNTHVNEFRLGGAAQILYAPADEFAGTLRFIIAERDERHTVERDERIPLQVDARARDEANKDNVSRRTMFASSIRAALTRSDTILFSGSASLLRYDTPSDENDDDRDELWYSLELVTFHRINRHLHVRLAADVNLTHLVYILKERSANNSWNRVFRLSPRVHYAPSEDLATVNTFEVLANYTVFDFETTPSVQVKSFSFRQFAFTDSTHVGLTNRFALEGFAHIRLYQRGELRWDAFKERPLNYFEDKTFIGRIAYSPEHRLLLSAGVRYFSQIRFGFSEGARFFESLLKSVGPVVGLRWDVGAYSQINIDGWYERQTQTNAAPRGFANMTMALNIRL